MAADRTVIHINPRSDLADALRCAETTGETLLIDAGELVFGIIVMTVQDAQSFVGVREGEPDSILNIIGIGASEEPGDVARNKYDYLAEAYLPTPEK